MASFSEKAFSAEFDGVWRSLQLSFSEEALLVGLIDEALLAGETLQLVLIDETLSAAETLLVVAFVGERLMGTQGTRRSWL